MNNCQKFEHFKDVLYPNNKIEIFLYNFFFTILVLFNGYYGMTYGLLFPHHWGGGGFDQKDWEKR